MHDCLLKRFVFKSYENILRDKNTDRPLSWEIVGRAVDRLLNLLRLLRTFHQVHQKVPHCCRC